MTSKMSNLLLSAFFAFIFLTSKVTIAQTACDPMDNGPYLAVLPSLLMSVTEATEEELRMYPYDPMFRSELRLQGVISSTSPNGMQLTPQMDYQLVDPSETFVFETDASSNKNRIRLVRPIDRDGPTASLDDDVNAVKFTLKCQPNYNTSLERLYTVHVQILDKNDNSPLFPGTYEVEINELLPVGSTVITVSAEDRDLNLDGNLTYSVVQIESDVNDGSHLFGVDALNGNVKVKNPLDYESLPVNYKFYNLRIKVQDGGMPSPNSAFTTVKITITDGDDLGPVFQYTGCLQHKSACAWPEFSVYTKDVHMNKEIRLMTTEGTESTYADVQAKDMDSQSSEIKFSILATTPRGFHLHFSINTTRTTNSYYRATLNLVSELDNNTLSNLQILIKAEEVTFQRRHAVASIRFMKPREDNSNMGGSMASGQQTSSDKSNEISSLNLGLIIAVAVALTLVVCLGLVVMVMTCRRRSPPDDKKQLMRTSGGHSNGAYAEQTPL
ncbi:hypothetical protein CHS0354_039472 [Potamilus streckersoni]|uniref:Cadherin domain-containing protein n=1 Tax=Potamilus streckersoni TaxID=2493646 RepID=A0AAE0S2R2_9BIVA|nr:hypothetical protein CHS0354_039472 [Potamilus streckersoni]